MATCRFFYLARGRRISTIPSLEYDADDARCFFIDDAVGRRPPARARDAARRTPRTERMTSSVASSVTTARCAYAASPVRRSTEVREFCARRFSDARRATRARDATTTRATRDDDDDGNATSPSTARARGLRGRGERAAARARGETGRDNFERAMRGGGGGRARAMREGTGATFDVTLAAAALSLHASGEASRDAAREDGARGTEMRGNG
jgi:hypothetical protein